LLSKAKEELEAANKELKDTNLLLLEKTDRLTKEK